jgi:hypothetical protein
MLAPAATERVIDCVHGNTSDNRPFLSPGSEFIETLSRLDQWLVEPSSAGNNTYCGHALRTEPLHLAAWELNYRLTCIMSYENSANS